MHRLIPHRLLRTLARLMVGAVLLAQALVAAHACAFAPDAAMPAMQVGVAGHGGAHCHEAPPADSANLCLKHCDADKQPGTAAAPAVAPMPALAVLHVPALSPAAAMSANGIGEAHDLAPAADPPPAIRFHAFRS